MQRVHFLGVGERLPQFASASVETADAEQHRHQMLLLAQLFAEFERPLKSPSHFRNVPSFQHLQRDPIVDQKIQLAPVTFLRLLQPGYDLDGALQMAQGAAIGVLRDLAFGGLGEILDRFRIVTAAAVMVREIAQVVIELIGK